MTCAGMLRFTRHYKDTIQERLTILVSFIPNLSGYTHAKNNRNRASFDKVIAKISWCSFFDSQCRSGVTRTDFVPNLSEIKQSAAELLIIW